MVPFIDLVHGGTKLRLFLRSAMKGRCPGLEGVDRVWQCSQYSKLPVNASRYSDSVVALAIESFRSCLLSGPFFAIEPLLCLEPFYYSCLTCSHTDNVEEEAIERMSLDLKLGDSCQTCDFYDFHTWDLSKRRQKECRAHCPHVNSA